MNGIPSSIKINGEESTYYDFSIRSSYKKFNRNIQTFYECWLIIKDHYYDKNLNFKNWNKIFEKYSKAARNAPDTETLDTVIELMLGELNGSHLGFNPSDSHSFQLGEWKESTAHLGIRFESQFDEDGLKIRDILPDRPAEKVQPKLLPGEIILTINGVKIDKDTNLDQLLTGDLEKNIFLTVK